MRRAHCSACNGYYGPAFDQPVCPTCHAFLYANIHDAEINLQLVKTLL
jgi:ubiquitin-conjugating enzyme E2 D/E